MRVIALILALLCVVLPPGHAFAHAALVSSNPDDGALLNAAPQTVDLAFNEPVEALALTLVSPQGDTVRLDGGRVATEKLRVAVPPGLGQGSHLLSWRVVSADGHPVGGSIVFSIGKASGGDASAVALADVPMAANPGVLALARWLMMVGLGIGVGGALFVVLGYGGAGPGAARWLCIALGGVLAAGTLAAISLIPLEGLEAHGLGTGAFWRPLTWRTGLRTPHAITAGFAVMAILLAGAGIWFRSNRATRATAVSALLCAGLALAMSGHAGTVTPRWGMAALVAMHVAAMAVWLGALLPLTACALQPNADVRPLQWFSRCAVPIFGVIVASGLVLALVQAGSVSALLASTYGQLLMAKLAVVALVLAIAGVNRWWLTAPAIAGDGLSRRLIGRAIVTELLAALVILGIVASWRLTPPPRALAQMREPKFQIHMHGTEAMASVLIQPARAGPVRVVIEPKTPDLAPLVVKEVTLSLTGEAPGMEPLRREARQTGDKWEIEGLTIPTAGRWRVRVELLIDDFERSSLDALIVVRP